MFEWTAPKPFITFTNDQFQLNNDVVSSILEINKPLAIVCIAGRLRSGKSFLMNRLVGKQTQTGFPLGSTVEAVTKGVWVWYLDHPLDSDKGLLVMDSEGLEDPDGGYDDYDMWILSLCILLSSTFIYNEIGLIGNSLVDKLSFVSKIRKRMKSELNEKSDANFDGFFPNFVLVIRDLTLELTIAGREVSDDEYMEQKMLTALRTPMSPRETKRNETKLKLRKYFPCRKCFTFISPLQGSTSAKSLEEMSDPDLPAKFVDKCNKFKDHIYRNSPVKTLRQMMVVDGPIFVQLASIYLDAINNHRVPCVDTAVRSIAENENIKTVEASMEEYSRLMADLTLPLDKEELERAHRKNHKVTVLRFFKTVLLDEDKVFHEMLQTRLANEYILLTEKNREASHEKCNAILEELYEPIKSKLDGRFYIKRGGYEEFNRDIEDLEKRFNLVPKKGALGDISLQTFLVSKRKDRDKIVLELLTETEKQREYERYEQEQVRLEARLEAQVERERVEQAKQNEMTLRHTLKEQLENLMEKHQADLLDQKKAYERILVMREREQKRLLEENFVEEARVLRTEIDDLRSKRRSVYDYVVNVAECLGDMISDALVMMRK